MKIGTIAAYIAAFGAGVVIGVSIMPIWDATEPARRDWHRRSLMNKDKPRG